MGIKAQKEVLLPLLPLAIPPSSLPIRYVWTTKTRGLQTIRQNGIRSRGNERSMQYRINALKMRLDHCSNSLSTRWHKPLITDHIRSTKKRLLYIPKHECYKTRQGDCVGPSFTTLFGSDTPCGNVSDHHYSLCRRLGYSLVFAVDTDDG